MRYIIKDSATSVVQQHRVELISQRLDKDSLQNGSHPELTGRDLYKMVRDIKVIPHFWDLKHQMYSEQGGICCYCGLKIFWKDGRKVTVEHLMPKGANRTLVGEYENLLLTCSVVDEDKAGTIAPNDYEHCGDSKGNARLNYTPLQNDVDTRFVYDSVGKAHETDDASLQDIATLNLNCNSLVSRRQSALSILFDENGDCISEAELRSISSNIMNRDANGLLHEFCFVIKQVADSLIS